MQKLHYLSVFGMLLLASCNAFEYQPYDGRVKGETDINNKNIALIEKQCAGRDTIKFAVISDTQRWYDDTQDFVNVLNKRSDIDFVIHGGDISDFGVTKEFLWQRDILNGLKVPYVVLLGNHDCLGDGEEIFEKVFGKSNFAFWAGSVKFICLNTNALEFDYSNPVPDFDFIDSQLDSIPSANEKTIFAMHARPYSEQFNNNVAKVFQYYIKRFPQLQFCLSAHDHHIEADDLFGDGVMYYASANIAKRNYLVFTILKKGYNYEVVDF
jgi:Icc-related predicted phosphoesterase